MEINGFDLNNDKNLNALDAASLIKVYQDLKHSTPTDKKDPTAEYMVDRQDGESFNQIKGIVAGAHHAGRSAYLQSLKDAISSGDYSVSTASIVDAMFSDGTVAALTL